MDFGADTSPESINYSLVVPVLLGTPSSDVEATKLRGMLASAQKWREEAHCLWNIRNHGQTEFSAARTINIFAKEILQKKIEVLEKKINSDDSDCNVEQTVLDFLKKELKENVEEPELEEKIVIEEIDNSMSPLPKRQCGAGAWPTPVSDAGKELAMLDDVATALHKLHGQEDKKTFIVPIGGRVMSAPPTSCCPSSDGEGEEGEEVLVGELDEESGEEESDESPVYLFSGNHISQVVRNGLAHDMMCILNDIHKFVGIELHGFTPHSSYVGRLEYDLEHLKMRVEQALACVAETGEGRSSPDW